MNSRLLKGWNRQFNVEMSDRFSRFLDRLESRIALFTLFGGGAVVSVIGGLIASATVWLEPYAPFAYFLASIITGIAFAILLWVALKVRDQWIAGTFRKQWLKQADSVNPLDLEFQRKQISLIEIIDKSTRTIKNKKFTDCNLIGPANIMLYRGCTFFDISFVNCDFVCVYSKNKKSALIYNVIPLDHVKIQGGSLVNCTIFVSQDELNLFKDQPNMRFITLTGDEKLDGILRAEVAAKN